MKQDRQKPTLDLGDSHVAKLARTHIEDKMKMIRDGLTLDDLYKVAEEIEVEEWLLFQILDVDVALKKSGNQAKLSFNSSDRLITLAEVYLTGYEIIQNPPMFKDWMKKKFIDSGDIPIEVSCMVTAMREIERVYMRMQLERTGINPTDMNILVRG